MQRAANCWAVGESGVRKRAAFPRRLRYAPKVMRSSSQLGEGKQPSQVTIVEGQIPLQPWPKGPAPQSSCRSALQKQQLREGSAGDDLL